MPGRSTTLIALLTALLASPALAEIARGSVFHDKNANGTRDAHERGVEGVRVSNGIDVVLTDTEGRYEILLPADSHIFVVKPAGYMTAIDANNIPRHSYTHKPEGSRDDGFMYAGVAPTGPLPERIDFPLVATGDETSFSAILIADPQVYTAGEVNYYRRDILAELVGTDAAFALSLGDLVGDDLDLLGPLNEAQAAVGVPWYSVIGNHDLNFFARTDEDSDETFERVYGPSTYAFQYGKAHFLVLDDVVWEGFTGLLDNGMAENGNYRGGLRDDQLEFIGNYTKTVPSDELIVLAMHIPVNGFDKHHIPRWGEVLQMLSGHPHTLSLSGHMHTQTHSFFGSEDGYVTATGAEHHHHNVGTASGCWWRGAPDEEGIPHATMQDGTPNGYAILDVTGNTYTVRYKAARRPASEQLRITLPETVTTDELAQAEVVVNVYNGSTKSDVRMRIDGGPWGDIAHVIREDPSIQAVTAREGAYGEIVRPIRSRVSAHIWVGSLPEDLRPGLHTIQVETVDMFGARHTGVRMFTVE